MVPLGQKSVDLLEEVARYTVAPGVSGAVKSRGDMCSFSLLFVSVRREGRTRKCRGKRGKEETRRGGKAVTNLCSRARHGRVGRSVTYVRL